MTGFTVGGATCVLRIKVERGVVKGKQLVVVVIPEGIPTPIKLSVPISSTS